MSGKKQGQHDDGLCQRKKCPLLDEVVDLHNRLQHEVEQRRHRFRAWKAGKGRG